MSTSAPVTDFNALKTRQQATWASGDYSQIGSRIQVVGELLCEALDLHSGWTVLDVAAGNGNASLAAARCFCDVTSTDYVPALLERGKARAEADGLAMKFQEADAENLPFGDDAFDAVVSTFGVMFTPVQERSAAEMFRVCKPGGKIGLACWTPESFVGQNFKLIGKRIPPPAGVKPPALWGTEARLKELFPAAKAIEVKKKSVTFRYLSAEHWFEIFGQFYGPLHKALAALDDEGRAGLKADFMELLAEMNRATDGTLLVDGEYLQAVITK